MKLYIFNILFLIAFSTSFSQTKKLVLKKSYTVDTTTTLNVDIDNVSIIFKESNDDKIYFDYSILFDKDSEDLIYRILKDVNAKVSKNNNVINLDVKNSMYLGEVHSMNVSWQTFKKHLKDFAVKKKKNKFYHKSKDSLLKEIDFSLGSDTNDYFKKLKLDNPTKIYDKSSREFKQDFVIKIPRNLKIKIKALHSKINFTFDVITNLEVNSFQTDYKFKRINNKNNIFNLINGIFQAEEIYGGDYNLKDLYKVKIGGISNVKLETETSKIQIGEINENVSFNDFNSKIHLYNFNSKFREFKLKGDYSELSLYEIKNNNYSMDVFGFNTALNLKKVKTTFSVTKNKKLIKILEKKPKNNSLNKVAIELKNGILNIK